MKVSIESATGPGGIIAVDWFKSYAASYRIAGNFRWVQIFAIFADRPASAKIKTAKK